MGSKCPGGEYCKRWCFHFCRKKFERRGALDPYCVHGKLVGREICGECQMAALSGKTREG